MDLDQEEVRRCIYRELKMLKTLRASDNIVSLKEAYRKRGNIYFVFEYVDRVSSTLFNASSLDDEIFLLLQEYVATFGRTS